MTGRGRCALAAAVAACFSGTAATAYASQVYVEDGTLMFAAAPGEINVVSVHLHPVQDAFVIADPGSAISAGAGCTGTPLGRVVTCVVSGVHPEEAGLALSLGDASDVALIRTRFGEVNVDAGAGDDRLDVPGGSSRSRVDLGTGHDTLTMEGYSNRVEVFGGAGDDDIDASSQDGGVYHGDGGNDTINASGWASGGDGDDTIDGRTIYGGTYLGGAGNDTINSFNSSGDAVDCGLGTDGLTHDVWDTFTACETAALG